MTAGKLASSFPSATTNTLLYSCPIGRTASAVLTVCNQGASTTYRVALRDYTQLLTLSSSAHTFNIGNPITSYQISTTPGSTITDFQPGDLIEDDLGKWQARLLDVVRETSTITVPTKVGTVGTFAYSTITPALTSFSVGNTITDTTNGLTFKYLGTAQTPGTFFLNTEPLSTSATSLRVNTLPTAFVANKYLAIPDASPATSYEIVQATAITTATYTATITRAQLGSTAAVIKSGSQAIIIDVTSTTKTINEGATFTASDTTLTLNNVTNLFVGDYLRVGTEIMTISSVDTGTSSVNVLRASLGTTASTHADGATVTRLANDGTITVHWLSETPAAGPATLTYGVTNNLTSDYVFSGDATGADPILTAKVGDTLVFNVNAAGHPFRLTSVAGAYNVANEITTGVTGAGTTAGTVTWVTTGFAAGTYYYQCELHANMGGQIILTTGDLSPTVTNGTSTARISTTPAGYAPSIEFLHDFDNNGDFEWVSQGYAMNLSRVYRFTQSDASNASNQLRFSDQTSLNPVYTSGVTYNGTAGTAGAYTQIDLTASSPTVLYSLSSTSANNSYGSTFAINSNPLFTKFYIYDVTAAITVTDTFTIGTTTPITQTVATVTPGAFGYVQSFSGTTLKVSLGDKSANFAAADVFVDTPLTPAANRTLATVSSVSDIAGADYLVYDKAISANSTDKHSGIVLGAGHSLLVYSGANTLNYVVSGFEDVTSDWTTVHYDQGDTIN